MQKIRENFALKTEKFLLKTEKSFHEKSFHVQNPAKSVKILPKREIFAKEKKEGKFCRNLSEAA